MAEEVKEKEAAPAEAVEQKEVPHVPQETALEEMKKQLEDAKAQARAEREAREAAEARASQASTQALQFRSQAEQAQYHGIERAIEGADARLAQLKSDFASAYSAGDIDKITSLQMEIGSLAARKTQMEDGRDAMKARLQQAAQRPQQVPQQVPADPVERLASQLSPRSAAWVRAHPESAKNTGRLFAVAQYATQHKGIEPDSDAFFDYVEKELGYKREAARKTEPQQYNRRSGLPAGRVSSTPVGQREVSASDIPDSPAVLEAATTAGVTPQQYKEQYIKLFKEGQIGDVLGVMH